MVTEIERLVYTVAEVQRMIGVSRAVVYECLHAGIIPCLRLGRRFVIPRAAFHRWLEESPWAKSLTGDKQASLSPKIGRDSAG